MLFICLWIFLQFIVSLPLGPPMKDLRKLVNILMSCKVTKLIFRTTQYSRVLINRQHLVHITDRIVDDIVH